MSVLQLFLIMFLEEYIEQVITPETDIGMSVTMDL